MIQISCVIIIGTLQEGSHIDGVSVFGPNKEEPVTLAKVVSVRHLS